jgi:hypothetical protein
LKFYSGPEVLQGLTTITLATSLSVFLYGLYGFKGGSGKRANDKESKIRSKSPQERAEFQEVMREWDDRN